MANRSILLQGTILVLACVAGRAHAGTQMRTWVGPHGGEWSNPANWSPADVPDTPAESAMLPAIGPGPYTVSLNQSYLINELIVAPTATLAIRPSATVANALSVGSLHNAGNIEVNPDGASLGSTLDLRGAAATNNGTIRATSAFQNAPTLILLDGQSTIDQTGGGRIVATGTLSSLSIEPSPTPRLSGVSAATASIFGGTIETPERGKGDGNKAGLLILEPGARLRLNDVGSLGGTFIKDAGRLELTSDITLTRNMRINSDTGTNRTVVVATSDITINGDVEVILVGENKSSALRAESGTTLTLGEGLTIAGRGQLEGTIVNRGTINPGATGDGKGVGRILRMVGDLTLDQSSVLRFDVFNRYDFAQLRVTGMLRTKGTVLIDVNAMTTLMNGHCIQIISAESVDASEPFDSPGEGVLVWSFEYLPDGVKLCVDRSTDLTTNGTNPGDSGFGVPDGSVTIADLAFFVEQWVAANDGVADVTTGNTNPGQPGYGIPDQALTVDDLTFFVELWIMQS